MRKLRFAIAAGLLCGTAFAGENPYALRVGKDNARTLRDFDIDSVVEAVFSGMTEASRNYYLPDGQANAKAIAAYGKDARFILNHNSDFKRSLAKLSRVLAETAVEAVAQDQPRLPGKPLALSAKQRYEPYDEGLSSITVTDDGEMKTIETNTMPCINAAAKGLFGGVRRQYLSGFAENSPESVDYNSNASASMSSDRLYNHVLSEVCAKLVEAAKRQAESPGGKKK